MVWKLHTSMGVGYKENTNESFVAMWFCPGLTKNTDLSLDFSTHRSGTKTPFTANNVGENCIKLDNAKKYNNCFA